MKIDDCVNDYRVGQSGTISRTITESEVLAFAQISGDNNPIHIDKEAAEKSRFGKRVVHGAFVSAVISAVLGNVMPGVGSIYLEQNVCFKKPVFVGDTITAIVTIKKIERKVAILDTTVTNQNCEEVVKGYAKVLLPDN